MAGKGLVIPLSLDPRQWITGIKTVERTLEDTEDSLEDVEDAGRDLGRKLEDAFDDAARGLKDVDRQADRTEDSIGDIEEEAGQSAKEFGAAFRGDPVEALEEVQSYLAEIISVKLPGFAGALATVAGGAAVGALLSFYEKWKERQDEINDKATDYLGIINGANTSLTQTNELLIAQAILEEASAAQMADLALLASARGQTVQQYVTSILAGEVSTTEQLAGVEAERQAIADRILELGAGRIKANEDEIGVLQAQDAILADQADALREQGTFLGDNVAATEKAKNAALLLEASYARAKREAYDLGRNLDYAARSRTATITVDQVQGRRLPL